MNNKVINQWNLFWLISIPMSLVMIIATMGTDVTTGEGVSHMIQFSVRWAIPFIYLVVAAPAIHTLFPGPVSAWLLRNRKYVGMCFAIAMAWQGLFIFIMSFFFREYYYEKIYWLRDEIEGSIGYIFLTAMVVTSFQFGRKYLTQRQWKILHRSAIYYIWGYPFIVYWDAIAYYKNAETIDYVFYWAGFLAVALRTMAWGKKRMKHALNEETIGPAPVALKLLGGAVVLLGVIAASTGSVWLKTVNGFITSPQWSEDMVLWLAYWPFEPFFSLLVILIGTALFTFQGKANN
jgi:DMSO/TMAO reductase YedYZ heme-binding membrane subunit